MYKFYKKGGENMEDSIVNTMQKELREFGEDDDKRWEPNIKVLM